MGRAGGGGGRGGVGRGLGGGGRSSWRGLGEWRLGWKEREGDEWQVRAQVGVVVVVEGGVGGGGVGGGGVVCGARVGVWGGGGGVGERVCGWRAGGWCGGSGTEGVGGGMGRNEGVRGRVREGARIFGSGGAWRSAGGEGRGK